ncbi:MAG: acyltransferase family protein, partial [Terracidiphilus sp.]
MTWSLGVEEQFYVVVPLLMALVARWRSRWILPVIAAVSLGSFVLARAWSGHHPMAAFYLLPSRAWELGLGVALAVGKTGEHRKISSRQGIEIGGVVALGLMIAAVVAHRFELTASAWAVLPAVAGAALAIAVPGSWANRRLLSTPPLRFIGKISYSWYLWHWPLLSLMHILYGGAIPFVREAETVALSFGLAVVSYFLIEQPFRRSTQPAGRMLARYALASAILLAACAAVWSSHGFPQRFPALAQMETPGEALRSDPCLAGLDRETPNLSPACYDAAADRPLVALWGDSHSAAIAPGLRAKAQAQGYSFAQLGKASCPPPDPRHAFRSAASNA